MSSVTVHLASVLADMGKPHLVLCFKQFAKKHASGLNDDFNVDSVP